MDDPYDLRANFYTRFRILVIGRANAGKTTLLQRVCNTTEDPCIYDETDKNLLEPTSARGIHDIHRPFAFRSNPAFIFHDSPGFETGDEKQLQQVLSFMEEKTKATEVDDQLHAIWFCFVLNGSRPLFPLETEFFETARAGKVPVIAIFTKFDDLMTQIYDMDLDDDANRKMAEEQVEVKFRKPLSGYAFPRRADVCFEALHTDKVGKHQEQVKALIEKTASSLDDTALKKLFVSVQQNNIGLCVRYAINDLTPMLEEMDNEKMVWYTMLWFGHSFLSDYHYGQTEANQRHLHGRRGQQELRLQNAHALGVILDANFKSNDSGHLSSMISYSTKWMSSLHIFAALLICMEHSFWNISSKGDFVDWFKKSFTLYNESGMRRKIEADVDILRNEHGGHQVTNEFKEKFHQIIMGHYL